VGARLNEELAPFDHHRHRGGHPRGRVVEQDTTGAGLDGVVASAHSKLRMEAARGRDGCAGVANPRVNVSAWSRG
jgi:hypothetical protein